MRLLTAHKITIGTSIAGCLAFAVWGILEYRSTGETVPIILAPLAVLLATVLTVYLRSFIRKHRAPRR